MRLGSVLLCFALGSSGSACSLLAPSDAELMGGGAHDGAPEAGDGGTSDGSARDGSPADATNDSDAACLPVGAFCNGVPSACCSHTCNGAAGKKCD